MNMKLARAIATGMLLSAATGLSPVYAATALVDFETTPTLATAPSIYVAVPGPQTITAGPATFTGGVVLGFATFFPAIAFASAPNVYGTADFGNGLAREITSAIDPTFITTEVSFALFNGETFSQSYTVTAFNGATQVASQTLANVAPNFNSGYGLIDVTSAAGITSVTVTTTDQPAAWDFLIDTVAFNQSISSVVSPGVIPPPPPVVQPAIQPVQGHRHGRRHGEVELVEVNFGDDVNDIRGSVLVVNQSVPLPVPEPDTYALLLAGLGLIGLAARRRT